LALSDTELKNINVTKVDAIKDGGDAGWSADDLKLARKPQPETISFTTEDGQFIEDAEVVRVNEGVSVIWRKGASGGTIKMANLPETMRRRFGYDPSKAAYAEEVERARRRQSQAEIQAAQTTTASGSFESPSPTYGTSSSSGYSSGGSVYVHSYSRRDGTYVSGYTRRK
jgi:hypothetical protein